MKLPVILKYLIVSFTFLFLFNCNKKNDEKSKNLIPNSSSILTLIEEAGDNNLPEKSRIQRIEKAILLAKESNNDSLEFKAKQAKMYLLSDLEMDKSAIELNHDIIQWTKELNNKKYLAEANFNFGNYYYDQFNIDSTFYYYNQAKNLFISINDSVGVAKSNLNISIILNNGGNYIESEAASMEALKYLSSQKNHPYLTNIYNALALSSGSMENYKEELYWYEKALEITEDEYSKVSINNNKAVAYTLQGDYKSAILLLNAQKNNKILDKEPQLKAKIIDNLAYAEWKNNPHLNVLPAFEESMQIRVKIHDNLGLSVVYAHLFEYYEKKNPTKALEYATKMYELSFLTKNEESRLHALKRMIINNPTPSLNRINEFIKLNDSLQIAKSDTKYQFAKIKYDADKNREQVHNLSLENANKELDLQRAKISIIITVSILVIATISFFSYTYYIRQKRKQETLETIYETEVKFSQKLHDELANDLFSTITLVDSITFEDQELKNKLIHNLDHIYSQTRNISRENNIIDTKNFKKELDIMLGSFKSDQVNVLSKGIDSINWDEIENQVKILIYRVLMELMTNMKKHSDCSIVVISFSEESNNILDIKYVDNGSISLDETKINKNGLKNVENRIFRLNGNINFDSSRGFKAFIKIPTTKKTKLI